MAQIDAPECALTESFRFGPTFAALASRILSLLGERAPIRGQDAIGSIMVADPSVSPPVNAILYRQNVTAIWQLAAGVEAGHKPAIHMSATEIVASADGADQLLAGKRAFGPAACSLFDTWKEAQSFAQNAVGRDLLPIVRIVDEFGTGYLRDLARRITPEAGADYVISTVHRAKGQWNRVKVANDSHFKTGDGRLRLDEDEMQLLYVAVTRAQHVLDISELREELLRLLNSRRCPHRPAPRQFDLDTDTCAAGGRRPPPCPVACGDDPRLLAVARGNVKLGTVGQSNACFQGPTDIRSRGSTAIERHFLPFDGQP